MQGMQPTIQRIMLHILTPIPFLYTTKVFPSFLQLGLVQVILAGYLGSTGGYIAKEIICIKLFDYPFAIIPLIELIAVELTFVGLLMLVVMLLNKYLNKKSTKEKLWLWLLLHHQRISDHLRICHLHRLPLLTWLYVNHWHLLSNSWLLKILLMLLNWHLLDL